MRNICFNSCLNTNEVEHSFHFCATDVTGSLCRPRGVLDSGCVALRHKVIAVTPHSPTHSFNNYFRSAHYVLGRESEWAEWRDRRAASRGPRCTNIEGTRPSSIFQAGGTACAK